MSFILTILYVCLGFCILILLGCIHQLIRNEWVYRFRMSLLTTENLKLYEKLPSYDEMCDRYFYIWNKQWFIDKARSAK